MTNYAGLFGLRLAPGLHLGHFVGNIRPAMEDQERKKINVILADLFTYTSNRKHNITLNNALSVVAECYALGLNSDNVSFIIQSEAAENLQPLFMIVGCLLKYKKISGIQPIKSMLLNIGNLNFGELSFPIVQCAEMIATKSDVLYSNIDNQGVVSLTKLLCKKVSIYTKTELPEPKLKHGFIPILHGTDGKKMSYSSNNAVFISDSEETIKDKITKIKTNPPDHNENNVPDFKLIHEYLGIFGLNLEQINEMDALYKEKKLTALEIKKILINKLTNFLNPVKQKKDQLLREKRKELTDRIISDTIDAQKNIKINTEEIFENFYELDYYKTFKRRVS